MFEIAGGIILAALGIVALIWAVKLPVFIYSYISEIKLEEPNKVQIYFLRTLVFLGLVVVPILFLLES